MDLTPIFRIEKFLDAIVNSTTPPEPVFREEFFLAKIAGADVTTPEPMFRIEKYLAKIAGEDVEIPEPQFRIEFWLAKLCGMDVETPEPMFRVEFWLEEWSGGSSDPVITLTGKIISFIAKAAKPFKSTQIAIEPVQSGTGDPSPDNVRPISGWTGCEIYDNGVNWLDASTPPVIHDYILNDNGVQTASDSSGCTDPFIDVLPNTTYILSGELTHYGNEGVTRYSAAYRVYFYDSANTFISRTGNLKTSRAATPSSFTTPPNCVKLAIQCERVNDYPLWNTVMLNLGSTASSYEAYNGTSVSLTFGQTVYGGTATDNGDGTWTVKVFPYYASYNGEPLIGPWLSSMDKYAAGTTPTTGAQVVDLGGTQTTFTVSGDTLETLVGTNNAWADTGNITAEVYGTPMT